MARLSSGFRSRRELAWTFATLTGTVGLILLMVLQTVGFTAAPKRTTADLHTSHRRPMALAQVEPASDPYGGLPNPFGEPYEPPGDFGADPFGPIPGFEPLQQTEPIEPSPAADLEIDFVRATPPADVEPFMLTDDEEQFVVNSTELTVSSTSIAFPPDDWLRAIPRESITRDAIIPAAYRELAEHPLLATRLPQPSPFFEPNVAQQRHIAISVRKSLPADTQAGEMLSYDLIVSNQSDDAIDGVILQEHVSEPHRVADAHPAAAFENGVLTWRFERLGPREERRLSVAVYPMSNAPIVTTATVRSATRIAGTTLVAAAEPTRPEPLPTRPEPEPTPPVEPTPSLEHRVRIEMTTPDRAAAGAACLISFAATNTGTAPLTGLAIQAVLPENLQHRHGSLLESKLGDLNPGETKRAELLVIAGGPGEPELIAHVGCDEGVATTVRGDFSIVESIATNDRFVPCCSPVGTHPDPLRR